MVPRILAVLLLSCACASLARAEDDAKAQYDRGTAMFALHKFAAAAAAYEKAFELRPDPAILYNAAQAHRLAGNKPRALELYESLQRLYGNNLGNHAEIANHIRALRHAIEVERSATNSPPNTPWPTGSPPESTTRENAPPTVTTPQPAPQLVAVAPPHKEPITKKRWFWGVIAGVAVVAVAGVTVGVVLGTARTVPPTPSIGTAQGN